MPEEEVFGETLLDIVSSTGMSRGQARRLIQDGAIDLFSILEHRKGWQTIKDHTFKISGQNKLKIGKHRFYHAIALSFKEEYESILENDINIFT